MEYAAKLEPEVDPASRVVSREEWLEARRALLQQEFNRFREVDAQIGRHVEEVIAEAEKRRTQAALAESRAKVNYAGLKDRIIGHKTIDGKELGLGDYIEMLAVTASRDRLANVTRVADAAICNQWHIRSFKGFGDHLYGRDLRHTHSCNNACRTN